MFALSKPDGSHAEALIDGFEPQSQVRLDVVGQGGLYCSDRSVRRLGGCAILG